MRIALAQVRRWDPDELETTGRDLAALRRSWAEERTGLAADRPDSEMWRGVAAEQARAAHDGWVARTGRMIAEVEPARAAYAAAAEQVAALRSELRRVEDNAAADNYVIGDHGVVTDLGAADTSGDEDRSVRYARQSEARADGLVEVTERVQALLDRAERIDTALTAVVRRAAESAQHLQISMALTSPATDPDRVAPARSGPTMPQRPLHSITRGGVSPAASTDPAFGPASPVATAVPVTTAAAASAARSPAGTGAGLLGPRRLDGGGDPGRGATVVVRAPDPRTGVHDSLWRIAARELRDGARWPEIFALNRGEHQPGGGVFNRPSLVFPGQVLRLPAPRKDGPADDRPTGPGSHPSGIPDDRSRPGQPRADSGSGPTPAGPPPPSAAAGAPAAGDGGGVSVGTEVFVGAGLAATVAGALLLVRRRDNRRYRPGSGRRDQASAAPVVYGLRRAHLRRVTDAADTADIQTSGHAIGEEAAPGSPRWSDAGTLPTSPAGAGPATSPRQAGYETVSPVGARLVGVRGGAEVALDLTAAPGVGLVGPGAAAVIRALLVTALAGHVDPNPTGAVDVVVTVADLAELLGTTPQMRVLPAGLWVVPTMADALDLLEDEILARTVFAPADAARSGAQRPLVFVGSVAAPQVGRLQQVLDHGTGCGVVGVLLGEWRPGLTVHVLGDGMVWTTDRGPGEVLRDAELFRVGADAAFDLLTLLGQARPRTALPAPTAGSTSSVPLAGMDDVVTVGDWSADDGTPAPGDGQTRSAPTSAVVAGEAEQGDAEVVEVGDDELEVTAAAQDTIAIAFSGNGLADDSASTDAASPASPAADSGTGAGIGARLRISVFGPPRMEWQADPRAGDTAATAGRGGEPATGTVEPGVSVPIEVTSMFPPRARELLMVLAVHPDGVTREALTAALWPDSPPERITNALNTALSRLRGATRTATDGAVDDLVLLGHGRYRLDPAVAVVEDHERFVDARHTHRSAGADPQRRAALQAMIDSYRGPFADGLSSEWIEATRESLRREVLDAVHVLARAVVGTDPEQTLALLETARGFDPHNDQLYRDIMVLQARLGRYEAIPRTLALLTARLAELGEQPEPEIVELAHRLGHPHRPASTTTPPAANSADSRTG